MTDRLRQFRPSRSFSGGSDSAPNHRHAESQWPQRSGARCLLLPDEALRDRPPGAAIFLRPQGSDPAFLVENPVPEHRLLLGQVCLRIGYTHLPRIILRDEGPHLVAENAASSLESFSST